MKTFQLVKSLNAPTLAVLFGAAVALTPAARADFSGPFAPANWSLSNNNADGSVVTATAPASITLRGGDNGTGLPGTTSYVIEAVFPSTVSFSWSYASSDDLGYDSAGWLLNGGYTELAGNLPWYGSVSFPVAAGDTFGFRVTTSDNASGRGSLTVSQFAAPVPEPGSMTLALLGGAVLMLRRRQSA